MLSRSKRLLILAAIVLPGCVTPTASFVSEQVVPNPDGSVRAFRVDFEKFDRPEPKARYTLSPIPLDENGLIPQQLNHIEFSPGIPREFAVRVRLYRPGYHTIELRPGKQLQELEWIAAEFLDQERAVDALLGIRTETLDRGWWELIALSPASELSGSPLSVATLGDYGLLPDSASAAHRGVLRFAAGEYSRLANCIAPNSPTVEKTRQRLEAKAYQIKRYAELLTTEEFNRQKSTITSR